jgi:hypothetical protein
VREKGERRCRSCRAGEREGSSAGRPLHLNGAYTAISSVCSLSAMYRGRVFFEHTVLQDCFCLEIALLSYFSL